MVRSSYIFYCKDEDKVKTQMNSSIPGREEMEQCWRG
jgi:hypothetical protein